MVEYWLNKNGTLQKSQTINITIDADSSYATVCWVGVIRNTDGCIGDDAQNYCESIYIGVNTSCTDDKQSSGTIRWNGCTITYNITQKRRDDCEDCGNCTIFYELIDAYVNPYYVTPDNSATTVYYQYWETRQDECHVISRVRESGSQQVPISPNVDCDAENRTISVPAINISGYTDCRKQTTKEIPISGLYCYVQKPENCCDESGISECYEINDIYYNPQKVDYSGGSVSFYFDYKKITYKDCKEIESFGRFQDSVQVPRCDGNDCCREKTIGIDYVWNGHTLCNGKNKIKLEIKQKKDPNYIGECKCKVEPDTGYCVNTHSVKRYYNNNGIWTEINPLASNPYVFPYYGGTMKVTWEYSAITVNDDCTSGVTSGNVWEDYIDILPYSGDECDGVDYATIQYTFKKSPCAFSEDTKKIISALDICNSSCEVKSEHKTLDCNGGNVQFYVEKDENACTNEFSIEYEQYRRPCSDTCESCFNEFTIELDSGGTVTSSDTASCNITLVESTKPSWLTVTVNGRNVSYSASKNTGSDRSAGVTFKLRNEECYDAIIVRQPGSNEDKDPSPSDPTIVCNCDTAVFEAYNAPKDIDKKGGTHVSIGSYIFNDCIRNVTTDVSCGYDITSNTHLDCNGGNVAFTATLTGGTGFISNVTFEDGAIYGVVSENTTGADRTHDINISCDVEGCGRRTATITVKQKGK